MIDIITSLYFFNCKDILQCIVFLDDEKKSIIIALTLFLSSLECLPKRENSSPIDYSFSYNDIQQLTKYL